MSSIKLFLSAAFITALNLSVNAQDSTTVQTPAEEQDAPSYRKPHQDMLLVDLNWDRMLGLGAPVKQKWYGRGISVSLLYDYPLNKNGNYSLAAGGAFTSHNYYTNAFVYRAPGDLAAGFHVENDSTVRARGKLSVNYVDVPIEFRWRTDENDHGHRWKVAVGGRVGYRIDVHEKFYTASDKKFKTYYYPHTRVLRYGPTVRFGYGHVMLSAFYSLSTFFETGQGLGSQNALSVGLTISPF